MILRKTLTATAVLLALALSSCGTTRRAGKDLGIVVVSPVLIPYAGFTDGFTAASDFSEGVDGGGVYQVLALPFTSTWHLLRHTFCVMIHAVDFIVFPVYGAAELHPYGPEIEPLDYYTGTMFDREKKSGTDAETGEPVEK